MIDLAPPNVNTSAPYPSPQNLSSDPRVIFSQSSPRRFPFLFYLLIIFFALSQVTLGIFFLAKTGGLSLSQIKQSIPFLNSRKSLSIYDNVNLPIEPGNPAVVQQGIYYFLEGNITNFGFSGKDIEVKTDIKGEGIPKFIITKNTLIYKGSDANQQYTSALASELKIGQHIRLGALYTLADQTWVTTRITIVTSKN